MSTADAYLHPLYHYLPTQKCYKFLSTCLWEENPPCHLPTGILQVQVYLFAFELCFLRVFCRDSVITHFMNSIIKLLETVPVRDGTLPLFSSLHLIVLFCDTVMTRQCLHHVHLSRH